MSKVILTAGYGRYDQMGKLTSFRFADYAEKHGYKTVIRYTGDKEGDSWRKLYWILNGLFDFGEVLWLDADVVIVDDSEDIADHVTGDMGLITEKSPNAGVWYVKKSAKNIIEAVLDSRPQVEGHPWWDNAGLLKTLGYYLPGGPTPRPWHVYKESPNEYRQRTTFLGPEWNTLPYLEKNVKHPRFIHCAGGPQAFDKRLERIKALVKGDSDT